MCARNRSFSVVISLLVFVAFPVQSWAATYVYDLRNHSSTNRWGFFVDPYSNSGLPFTSNLYFDFNNAQSNVDITYNDNGTSSLTDDIVRLVGVAIAGHSSTNPSGSPRGLWEFDFTYRAGVQAGGSGIDDFDINQNAQNFGSIRALNGVYAGTVISNLFDRGMSLVSLEFDRISTSNYDVDGWYCLNRSSMSCYQSGGATGFAEIKAYASPGTAPVPEPASMSLLILGLLGATYYRRRYSV